MDNLKNVNQEAAPGTVPAAMSVLRGRVAKLDSLVTTLIDRLTPVMLPWEVPTAGNAAGKLASGSVAPLANEIDDVSDRIASLIDATDVAIERLGV